MLLPAAVRAIACVLLLLPGGRAGQHLSTTTQHNTTARLLYGSSECDKPHADDGRHPAPCHRAEAGALPRPDCGVADVPWARLQGQ